MNGRFMRNLGALSLLGVAALSYTSMRRSVEDRRRARAELAASEERYRRTFEQARIGIAHLAPDGRWLRVNERLCEILELRFEAHFAQLFPGFRVSGDSGRSGAAIGPRPSSPRALALLPQARATAPYLDLIARLGYAAEPGRTIA